MDNESPIIKIAQEYKDHPVLTALIQLITPYVYALDTLLMTHLQSFRDSRLIIFFVPRFHPLLAGIWPHIYPASPGCGIPCT